MLVYQPAFEIRRSFYATQGGVDAMKYLIHRGGQQYGPYSVEELKQFVASGNVLPSDMAWAEGMPAWMPVSQILGGAPAPAPAPGYQAPSPVFAQPPSAAPASFSSAPAGGPMPPSLHWALVLVITALCGIFGLVWLFVEASFVKKLDPNNKSIMMLIVSFLVVIGGWIVMAAVGIGMGGTAAAMGSERVGMVLPVIFLMYLVVCVLSAVFGLLGVFGMRRSLLNYYNTVEPVGLQLSPVMTFFFALFYFQYHFTRIANWKRTGVFAA
jgi:hypothetical protein